MNIFNSVLITSICLNWLQCKVNSSMYVVLYSFIIPCNFIISIHYSLIYSKISGQFFVKLCSFLCEERCIIYTAHQLSLHVKPITSGPVKWSHCRGVAATVAGRIPWAQLETAWTVVQFEITNGSVTRFWCIYIGLSV